MAEASSSRARVPPSLEESSASDEERVVSRPTSSRHSLYDRQRSFRRTTSGSSVPSRSHRTSYHQPGEYGTAAEEAVPPPVNPDDWKQQHPPSALEHNIRYSRGRPESSDHVRRRRSANEGDEELTEVSAPPPIPRSRDGTTGAGARRTTRPVSESLAPGPPRHPSDYVRTQEPVPQWLTELYTISYLIFFAIWGTLARLGVQWLTFYPGTPIVTPVIWANFGGSLVLGFLAEDQALFYEPLYNEHTEGKEARAAAAKRKKAIPLYIGLATGFCGSFTSFSSFARDVFLALSNNLPTPVNHPYPSSAAPGTSSTVPRNGGYSFEALLHVIMSTLALSLGGLLVGAQLAVFFAPITPRINGSFTRKIVDRAMVILGLGCWLGAVLLAIFPPSNSWRGEAVFALVFAPLGCLLRYYISMKLNSVVPAYPLGTFAVNMFGTAIEGMCFDIQHVRVGIMGRLGGGILGCQVLQGVMDGFCGCLTTVSTWVAEINGLQRKHAWAYAFGSVLGGFCLMVIIMGSVRWTVGYSDPVCDTGYTSKIQG